MSEKELYNSRIINGYIKLLRSRYSFLGIDINELLQYAGMEMYQVEDQGHWFSQEQINRFYDKCRQLTGNDNLAREAGRYAISLDAIGAVRQYILGRINPAEAFLHIAKLTPNFTRSAVYQTRQLSTNSIEVLVTPLPGIEEKSFQCENRTGYFEAVGLSICHELPEIYHDECIFRGDNVCRYVVSWRSTAATMRKKIRNYGAVLLAAISLAFLLYASISTFFSVFAVCLISVLALDVYTGMREREDLHAALSHLNSSSEELIERIEAYSNNTVLVNEIGLALSKQLEIESILKNVLHVLEKRLDYDRGLILLANKDNSALEFRAGFGYSDDQMSLIKNASFHIHPDSKGPFVVSFVEKKPVLINDIDEIASTLSARSMEFAKRIGTKSFICCPIFYENESLGILAVDNKRSKRPLLQSDVSLLMGIAPEIGISIHNAQLIKTREEQFKSTILALAASIDARDFLTAGHSEKVTEYAVGISKELGLDDEYCEMIRVASLLHDYGKIGIRDSILKKPGSLTDEEYDEIKTHAEKTRDILVQINFQGVYREVPHIAAAHHEKIDGSGYPKGLKGDAIPLGAKIIAVADFFEAVTAKRHYRDPMPEHVAIQMLEERRDMHYDGNVIDAFRRFHAKISNVVSVYSF